MWMLLQLFEIMPLWRIVVFYMMLLQVSYLKTNMKFWCCLTKAAQVVRIYSDLNDFNQSQKFDFKQVSDLFVHNLRKLLYIRNPCRRGEAQAILCLKSGVSQIQILLDLFL